MGAGVPLVVAGASGSRKRLRAGYPRYESRTGVDWAHGYSRFTGQSYPQQLLPAPAQKGV
jgi:hypothetical protein